MSQCAALEIDKPLWVECETAVPRLEMQMRSCRTSRGTAQTDGLSCSHPVARGNQTLGQMRIESLQTIVVTDDHQIAIASVIL